MTAGNFNFGALDDALDDAKEISEAEVVAARARVASSAPLPASRPEVYISSSDSATLTRVGVEAIATAKLPGSSNPFVMMKGADDEGEGIVLVSVSPSGAPRFWSKAEAAELALSVLQPIIREDEETGAKTYGHAFPKDLASLIFNAALHSPLVNRVQVVSNAPIVMKDGSIAATPGYNSETETLVTIPIRAQAKWSREYATPVNPTRQDALEALRFVNNELLHDVPFAGPADRATTLAMFLTAVSRHLYGIAPAFGISASEKGTGKGLIAELMRILAKGDSSATGVSPLKSDDEENWKTLVACAMNGERFIHVDEIERSKQVNSLALTEILTSARARRRVLGVNKTAAIEGMLLTVTGNRLDIGGDLGRRFLKVNLHYSGSGPAFQRSSFRHDNIQDWTMEHRPELLAALHAVLVHGIENTATAYTAFGSFAAWSAVVLKSLSHFGINSGGDIVFVEDGEPMPALIIDAQKELNEDADKESEEWGELLSYVLTFSNGEWMKMSDIHTQVTNAVHRPNLPIDLLPAAGQHSASTVNLWSRVFKRYLKTPMTFGHERFAVQMRTVQNTNQFLVEKLS
jgi:hypothetical protein